MPPRLSLRPIGSALKPSPTLKQPSRSFSYSIRRVQEQATQPQDGKTTHFGFKTVAESEKQAKGTPVNPPLPHHYHSFIP